MKINSLTKYDIFKDENLLSLELLKEQGLCNKNYILNTSKKSYLVRHLNVNLNINRQYEFKNQVLAYEKNISAKIYLLDENNSIMICDYIEGKHKYNLEKNDIKSIANILKKLHNIKNAYNKIDLKEQYKFYDNKFFSKDINIKINKHYDLMNSYTSELVLCHGDLNANNILFNNEGIKFIDWEYSCLVDRYFDISSILIEFNLNTLDEEYFISNYLNKNEKINNKKVLTYKIVYLSLAIVWLDSENEKIKKENFLNILLDLLK